MTELSQDQSDSRGSFAQIKDLYDLARPHRTRLLLTTAFVVAIGLWEGLVLSSALPVLDSIVNSGETSTGQPSGLFGWAFDLYDLIPEDGRQTVGIVLLVALEAVRAILTYLSTVMLTGTTTSVIVTRRAQMLRNVMSAKLSYFDRNRSGDMFQTVSAELVLTGAALRALINLVATLSRSLVIIVLMIALSWKLVLVLFGFFVLNALATYYTGKRIEKTSEVALSGRATLMVDLNEAAAAIRQHKGLGSEGRATERMSSFSALAEWRRRRQTLLGALLNPIATLLGLVAIAVILVISVRSDVFETGEAEVASLLLFLLLITRLLPIISMVNANYGTVKGVAPSVAKVNKIIDIDPSDLEDYDGQTPTPLISDRISFRDVTFAYEGKGPALRNVTFDIPAGSTVAVVGESGAGKSTVRALLPRFYETQSGSVQYDGADVKSIDLNHLRDRIGIVSQGLILFADTVEENIRAGKPDATGDQIVAAAKQASAHEFIEQLPSKYQTLLGERGVTLSEGQRQRIAIAQAFLKSPELLILDEATSALDSESEMRVQEAIEELSAGRTVLLVAHRLTTVKGADTVVVLKDGTIAEMGTIEELLSSRGEFWKMCERQGLSEDDMIAAS